MNKKWFALILGIVLAASPAEGYAAQTQMAGVQTGRQASAAQTDKIELAAAQTAKTEPAAAQVSKVQGAADQSAQQKDDPYITYGSGNLTVMTAVTPDEMKGLSNGWHYVRNSWYYVRAGKPVTGWLKVSGKWYYLGSDGVMKTGWLKVGGKTYYLNKNGAMRTGWLKKKNASYYFLSNGVMRTGWLKLRKKWYYFDANGVKQTGWLNIGGKQYYLGTKGAMRTGWVKLNGVSYYFDKNGVRNTAKEAERNPAAAAKTDVNALTLKNGVKTKGDQVAAYALKYVGNPYVYGGCSLTKGTDCSGFVMLIYKHFGVNLPHYDAAIRSHGKEVSSLKEAKAGDIVCYYGHVAIYLGDGRIVHASNSRDGIKISERADYRTIACIRRIFN